MLCHVCGALGYNPDMPRQRHYYGLNHLHFITASTYRRARRFDCDRFRRQFVPTPLSPDGVEASKTQNTRELRAASSLTVARPPSFGAIFDPGKELRDPTLNRVGHAVSTESR